MVLNDERKDVNIYEMIKMIHYPEMNRLLNLKLQEYKNGEFKKCIDEYDQKKEYYCKSLCRDTWDQEQKSGKKIYPPLYWFELTKYKENDWSMTIIDPWPPKYMPYYAILPTDIISRMTEALIDQNKLITWNAAYSKSMNKKVDVKFVRFATNHIIGSVRENFNGFSEEEAEKKVTYEGNLDMTYKLFFLLLERHPDLVNTFVKEFVAKALPVIKKREG
jgi:hypothetical protein